MSFQKYGFIFLGEGMKSEEAVLDSGRFRAVMVGIDDPADAPAVAKKMADDGVQLIDLCGAFGPIWAAKVLEATGQKVPVGHVNYGVESIEAVISLDG